MTRPAIGTRRQSYTASARGVDGRTLNNGHAYIDMWDTSERAREWATEVFSRGYMGFPGYSGPTVYSVAVYGKMLEFRGDCWHPVPGGYSHELIWNDAAIAVQPDNCYDTTVMDFYEWVHPLRADGSCQCGQHKRGSR